ncbi:hypothetical protein [Piscinibacter sp. HJYY11]|uniref:hypothetical protein n=1 Tax=Piscinibacter sp. HJYY11 TaxID=2801333 RepID=UPI00191F5ABC|nr:hypothetical protein [Piscinibacter sp. HJYY11]MBL0727779.1 hypothetical protein [Piscinibacter sp. HJYY11]
MKTAPSLIATVTAVGALAAGGLLASEDRMLFEPQQATLVGLVDDVSEALIDEPPAPRHAVEPRRSAHRAGSGALERR